MMSQPHMQPCLDDALRFVWEGMGPMPDGMVLIGGTAVALYFNHRASTDLDWIDASMTLNETSIYRLAAFDDVADVTEIHGGDGAVDCILRPRYRGAREIDMNFVEPDGRFVPELTESAIPASDNGVLVAHPIDLARMKTMALFSRREQRDYLDVGTFAEREPEILLRGVNLIRDARMINERQLVMALVSPPENILEDIPMEIQVSLTAFANEAFQSISNERPIERKRERSDRRERDRNDEGLEL